MIGRTDTTLDNYTIVCSIQQIGIRLGCGCISCTGPCDGIIGRFPTDDRTCLPAQCKRAPVAARAYSVTSGNHSPYSYSVNGNCSRGRIGWRATTLLHQSAVNCGLCQVKVSLVIGGIGNYGPRSSAVG